jgi:hypothetical protein
MTQILAREDGTRYFGDNQQNFTNVTTGKAVNNMFKAKIEWLAEGVKVGDRYTAGYGAVITVGKGLSILGAAVVNIQTIVETALNNAAEEYRKKFEELALIRVTPNEEDKSEGDRVYSHIKSGTLRGFNTIHRASAAGDPHFHAHVVLSSYAEPTYKRNPADRTRKSIYSNQIMIGEDRVIDVASHTARIKLYETLLDYGININPLNGEVIYNEITRETIQQFSKMRKMIEFITGEGIAVDDEQARILARQQMQHGGRGIRHQVGWERKLM